MEQAIALRRRNRAVFLKCRALKEYRHMDNATLLDRGTEPVVGGPESGMRYAGDAEDDVTMQLRAFGTLPAVRTLRLTGSRCDVLEWLESPRA